MVAGAATPWSAVNCAVTLSTFSSPPPPPPPLAPPGRVTTPVRLLGRPPSLACLCLCVAGWWAETAYQGPDITVYTLQEGHIHTSSTTYFILPLLDRSRRCGGDSGDISCLEHRLLKISSASRQISYSPDTARHQHQGQTAGSCSCLVSTGLTLFLLYLKTGRNVAAYYS